MYDETYSKTCGKYRIDRITEVVEEFIKCGDYREGIARIKCTNLECGHDYFVPLSCKSFYLCPSCHQKRTLLFSEQITQKVLLRLPHRQWVFCIPKCLRIFFKHNRMLFSDISGLIFNMLQSYYNEVSGKSIQTGAIIAYESAGDFLRWNSHWHGLILEGGFDEKGTFIYLPISDTNKMTELFRRLVIKYFQEKNLINERFARNLLSWKNSGFSVDNTVRIYGNDNKAREALSQYIAKPPVSLEKIKYEPFYPSGTSHGKVLYKTPKYNEYFNELCCIQHNE
ncbi:MAG: transposase [Planctomycetes bacterium]|nr:transposase [Planctomycetota bacterium]